MRYKVRLRSRVQTSTQTGTQSTTHAVCARSDCATKCSLLQGWGLIDLLLREFNEGSPRPRVARAQKIIRLHPLLCSKHPLKGVVKAALYCAHRTSTVSPCAFCEQEGHLAAPSSEAARCASMGMNKVVILLLILRRPFVLLPNAQASSRLPALL
jgi:hypothetical protein